MPRNMSFALTTQQIIDRTKTVTRRIGWTDLLPGELFHAVEKCQGMQKGEKIVRLALCRCVMNNPTPLEEIRQGDVVSEGFPDMTPAQFVAMFCKHMGCQPNQLVNRIEFEYVDEPPQSTKGSDHGK